MCCVLKEKEDVLTCLLINKCRSGAYGFCHRNSCESYRSSIKLRVVVLVHNNLRIRYMCVYNFLPVQVFLRSKTFIIYDVADS